VIIGGGLAGGNAAATLRDEGFPGPVVLISREPGVPFGRPPLSKTYLRSEESLDGWYVRPAGWYADHDVDLRNGTSVVAVDPAAHTPTLRAVPEQENGVVVGIRIFGVRADDLASRLGLQNGDRIERVMGRKLDTVQALTEAWSWLPDSGDVDVDVTRRGQAVHLVVHIE